MSKRSSKRVRAINAFRAGARNGAHETREAYERHIKQFVAYCYDQLGKEIQGPSSIKVWHCRSYCEAMLATGTSRRTLQNHMATIRRCLRYAGRGQFAKSNELSNSKLGIESLPGDRVGKKRAPTQQRYEAFVAAAERYDTGVAAMLRLERWIGLRREEALMAVRSLPDWRKQFERTLADLGPGGQTKISAPNIKIVRGTKGGRHRDVKVVYVAKALDAVYRAERVAKQRGGYLIRGTRQQALKRYENVTRKIGMVGRDAPHGFRYAYTHDRLVSYIDDEGLSVGNAVAAVSQDLGHGPGRGRWVRSVYGRSLLIERQRAAWVSRIYGPRRPGETDAAVCGPGATTRPKP